MTGDPRRDRGGQTGPATRRGRARVAGERAAERRRRMQEEPQPPQQTQRRRLSLPTLPSWSTTVPSWRPTVPRRLTGVLGVLVLLAAVGVGFLGFELRQADATASAAADGQVTAARYAEQLLSYDHAHLDRDFSESKQLLADGFVRQYAQATDAVREQAIREQAVIRASVVASSVVSAEPDRVKTLLFVNQTTTKGPGGGSPSIDLNRVVLTLVRQDGRWLVGDLEAL